MATFERSLQQFKKFNRQRRVQYSEESFALGIKYATSPLELGYSRNLVNFDLGTDENSLVPRKGLRTFEISQELNPSEEYDSTIDYKERQIYYASENIEEDGFTYRQILLGNVRPEDSNFEDSVKMGDLQLVTIYPKEQNKEVTKFPKVRDEHGQEVDPVEVLGQHTEDYSDYEFFFNSPSEAIIHGTTLKDPSRIATHIGTELAAEGTKKYYCFRKYKETGVVEPVFITFDKEKGYYVFEVLETQATTAYDASVSMYNMLQDNPYKFDDNYTASTLQFMGIYTTDLEGNQVSAAYINTEYYFRANYAAAQGQKYKVVWEWKEPTASNWTEIETQYYDFTEEEPPVMQIKWSAPVRAVIIRVMCYPYDNTIEKVHLARFSSIAPTPTQGIKYYDPDTFRIYTYNNNKWEDELPRTTVYYIRDDENGALYRWGGNTMLPTDDYSYISTNTMLNTIALGDTVNTDAKNLDLINYDLSTCRGMVTWGKRIGLYAPDKALNMLFLSEPSNPAWFPYPRNACLYSENIIKCVEYLDYLLVFTTNSVIQLTMGADGNTWTETCLQKNLNLNTWDIPFIKIIKNMVFFKSNNYFYMVVPSTTSISGLTIAPISTNIEILLDNFEEAVEEMMIEVYDNKTPYHLEYYSNHVNYKNIYNIYTFKSDRGMYFNLFLIYNITTRYWTIYCIESKTLLDSYKIDVADVNIYMAYAPTIVDGKVSNGIQFLKYEDVRKDFYIHPYVTTEDDIQDICYSKQFFKNYQYIDTGYREHESDFKKRFRELQFKLNNLAQLDLTFYTQFMIDGYVRQDEASYTINKVVERDDPRYGVITYDRIYAEEAGHHIPGATILGETPLLIANPEETDLFKQEIEHNPDELTIDKLMWKLNISEFPETVFWKVRFPVSGKGYVPRLKILNMDQENYEILNISWVFRSLYSR